VRILRLSGHWGDPARVRYAKGGTRVGRRRGCERWPVVGIGCSCTWSLERGVRVPELHSRGLGCGVVELRSCVPPIGMGTWKPPMAVGAFRGVDWPVGGVWAGPGTGPEPAVSGCVTPR
jgi:hypothetical protein